LDLLSRIIEARKNNEENLRVAKEIANAVRERERDIVETNKLQTTSQSLNTEDVKKKKDIFISYCWANKPTVKKLQNILEQKGFNCWIDDNMMQGGSQLFGEINDGISDSKVFVSCVSNSYSSSVNCQRELLLATDRKKFVIPVLVGPCDPWPPKGQVGPLLAGKLYVDLSTEEKFDKTVEQLIIAIEQSIN